MKILIGLACLVVATSAIDKEFLDQIKAKMKESVESCAKEVSASPDDVAEIFSHKIPSTHEGKCVFFCIHKMFNAQREDGSLDMEGAMSNLDILKDMDADLHAKVSSSFKNCESTPSDSDPCIYASNLVECIIKESKAVGLDETLLE